MAIRCVSKAMIVENGLVLLNKCKRGDGSCYYNLPGGGQNVYETLEQAVVREVKEETGYDVRVIGLLALAEEIYTSDDLRKQFPEYTHQVFHVFQVERIGSRQEAPEELDFEMEESVWVPLNDTEALAKACSPWLRKLLLAFKDGCPPMYLGTEYKA